jgi:glycosyltransferase involved in cell wall biosynthesis
MPVYNCQQYVAEAVESILHQRFTDFELIIIDDVSTDKTFEIISAIHDPRVKLIRKERNTGYTESLNYGLSLATGELIARMDGDDISMKERFTKQVNFLDQNPEVIACGTWFMLMNDKRVINHPFNPEHLKVTLMDYCAIGHPTVMFRKDKMNELGYTYNAFMEPAEDYDLWTRLAAHGKLANIPEVLLHYRVHNNQVSSTRLKVQQEHARQSQVRMLKYIMPDANEEETLSHIQYLEGTGINSLPRLEELITWGKKLVDINETVRFYDRHFLEQLIVDKEIMLTRKFFNQKEQHNLKTLALMYTLRKRVFTAFSKIEIVKLVAKAVLFRKRTQHAV